jgi:DNA polymerase IV
MKDRQVIYIDPPAFCTTVEGLVAPALRERPVVVAAPGADRATVLALSPEARAAGLSRDMPVRQAKKVCPDVIILPPNPRLYARASRALHEILRCYAPIIEPRSWGHAYLDVSGTGRLFGPAVDVAARIARESRERLGLAVSAGVAVNKLVSAACGALINQGGTGLASPFEVIPGAEPGFLAPRPVSLLPDLSEPVREQLDEYQLDLIGEIAAIEPAALAGVFGPPGYTLHAQARGVDPRPVLPPEVKAEFRAAHTLATDTNDLGVLHRLLRRLVDRLGQRLRQRRLAARRLTVKLAYTDYATAHRSLPLAPAALDLELYDAARRAFALANQRTVAIRAVGITVDRLLEADTQLELFEVPGRSEDWGPLRTAVTKSSAEPPSRRAAELQRSIDRIRSRWGRRVLSAGY